MATPRGAGRNQIRAGINENSLREYRRVFTDGLETRLVVQLPGLKLRLAVPETIFNAEHQAIFEAFNLMRMHNVVKQPAIAQQNL
jgi:hypothetical protein